MANQMTWDEIKATYPDEWVAVVEYEQNGAIGVNGVIAAHASDKETFYEQEMKKVRESYTDVAVRYTGQMIKNPEIPLLWQITDSTSNMS